MNVLLTFLSRRAGLELSGLRRRTAYVALMVLGVLTFCVTAQGAYLLEIDTDGADDGVVMYNSNFSFGGDTTTASSSVPVSAYGSTGGDSIFGGDGASLPDTYVYTYSPGTNADNLAIPAGTDLGGGNLASGLAGGGLGTYRVYATWPYTENVSGPTHYTISTAGAGDVIVDIDQNMKGDEWIFVGDIFFSDPGSSIIVKQEASINSFVSMRAYGVMWEAVPEPCSVSLLGLGMVSLLRRRGKP